MSNSIVPWLQVGVRLPRSVDADQAVAFSHLDYPVTKKPLRAVLSGRSMVAVDGFYATVRTDLNRCLGICRERYTVIQNRDAFRFLSSLANRQLFIETGGMVDGGKKAWLLVRLPQEMRIGRSGDAIRKYLLVVNSHDSTTNLTVKPVAIRIICSNSIPTILRNNDPEIRIRHTAAAHDRILEVRSLLQKTDHIFNQMEYLFNRLALKRVTSRQILEYITQLIPDNPEADSNARTANMRKRILSLTESGIGAEAYQGSLMSLVNAVAEAVDRQPSKDANKHLKSIWFGGSGEALKERSLLLADKMLNN